MGKRSWLAGVCLLLLGLAVGGSAAVLLRPAAYIPPLQVEGDVARCLTLTDIRTAGQVKRITARGRHYRGISLSDLVAAARPRGKPGKLFLIAGDGFTAAINYRGIGDCYIAYSASNGWEAVNLRHPLSSNVQSLKEIVVVAEGGSPAGLSVISQQSDLASVTPGQLLTGSLLSYFYHEGDAALQKGKTTYRAGIYTLRRVCRLSDLLTAAGSPSASGGLGVQAGGDSLLVVGASGSCRLVSSQGYFDVRGNDINYLLPEQRLTIKQVRGVVVNPPVASVTDSYYDMQHFLENNQPVLTVIIDGFTYRQYAAAAAKGYAPFLKGAGTVRAVGVYPLGDRVGFAALISGQTPDQNGVDSDSRQKLQTPTIFAESARLKKRALLLEADQQPLQLEINPVRVTDRDGDGSADDELCAQTLASVGRGYGLVLVRFPGIEASGEKYGALAEQTLKTIKTTDRYLSRIVSQWPGPVIIAGDQGAASGKLAAPLAFSSDRMFVPYLCLVKK